MVLVADASTGRMLGGVRTEQAFERRYHPASLFKLAIAHCALTDGGTGTTLRYRCRGVDTIDGVPEECWLGSGHGSLRFREALGVSCNLYFRRLASSMSTAGILRSAAALGMTEGSGFPGDPVSAAPALSLTRETLLGEAFTVSPAQMLRTGLLLASRGRLGVPPTGMAGGRFLPLYDGLRYCIREGTGKGAWSRRYTVAGKTGTAIVQGTSTRTVGWFVGFAPADQPRYVVTVLLHDGKGADAAVVAGKILQELM